MSEAQILHKAFLHLKEKGTGVSKLQRKFRVAYPRAARIKDKLIEMGLLSEDGKKISETFVCVWCREAMLTKDEYTYPISDYGGICEDFIDPICVNCLEAAFEIGC
jgi:hypothetical protein